MATGYDILHDALYDRGLVVASTDTGIRARCPAHNDSLPSLSVSEGDNGFPLAYCHAGCTWAEVIEALGIQGEMNGHADTTGDRIVAQYVYEDEQGNPLYRVIRRDPKGFHQERRDGEGWALGLKETRKVLYNLPRVVEAVRERTPIYLLEGEKDVETFKATQTGAVATCYVGGAGKWSESCTGLLAQASDITIVADRDAAGRKHATLLLSKLPGASIRYPAVGKDFTDHIYGGFNLGELLEHEPIETDWDDWDEEIPEFDWLVPGILARGTLVWAYGPKESAKSMYLLEICTRLSHKGVPVTYYSEEMARTQDKRRIARFGPDRKNFRWKNGRGLDLSNEDHVAQVVAENQGTGLIVLDSYERVYDPPVSNENKRAIAFARMAHGIIVQTGATIVVIDHTGFGYRDESGNLHEERKPRGASAKEQQADMSILFTSRGKWRAGEPYKFRIENMKPGRLENPFIQDLEVTDTPDGGLSVVRDGFRTPLHDEASSEAEVVETEATPSDGSTVALAVPASDDNLASDDPGPIGIVSLDEAKRIRYYVRKGMSRDDARKAVEIEKMFNDATT